MRGGSDRGEERERVGGTREGEGGRENEKRKDTGSDSTDRRRNEARYDSRPNIRKEKSKPRAAKTPADYGVDVTPRLSVVKVEEPAKRTAGVKVADVDELVGKLKTLGVAK